MDILDFRRIANHNINVLWDLIEKLPSKGDTELECQRLCLINALYHFQNTVDGTREEDLIEDEYECRVLYR